jgi:GrpB-like predicted nucleotidyltransferase (UPF0157 family)
MRRLNVAVLTSGGRATIGLRRGDVVLHDWDPSWPTAFEHERQSLADLLGSLVDAVEHVGSTAVRGLAAKPIIDVALGFRGRAELEAARAVLIKAGYNDRGDFGDSGGVVVAKGAEDLRTHYLHLVSSESDQWRRYLLFRDVLSRDAELRHEYTRLKHDLAARFPRDRDAYTAAKAGWIEAVLGRQEPPNSQGTNGVVDNTRGGPARTAHRLCAQGRAVGGAALLRRGPERHDHQCPRPHSAVTATIGPSSVVSDGDAAIAAFAVGSEVTVDVRLIDRPASGRGGSR